MEDDTVKFRIGHRLLHMKRDLRFRKAFQKFCDEESIPRGTRRYMLRGAEVEPTQTPRDVGVTSNDVLEVEVKQRIAIVLTDWQAHNPDTNLTVETTAPLLPALRAAGEEAGLHAATLRFEVDKGLVNDTATVLSLKMEEGDNVVILHEPTDHGVLIRLSLDLRPDELRMVTAKTPIGKVLDWFCNDRGVERARIRVNGMADADLLLPVGRGPYFGRMRDVRRKPWGPPDFRPTELECFDTQVLQRHLATWHKARVKALRVEKRARTLEARLDRMRSDPNADDDKLDALDDKVKEAQLDDNPPNGETEPQPKWRAYLERFATEEDYAPGEAAANVAVHGR